MSFNADYSIRDPKIFHRTSRDWLSLEWSDWLETAETITASSWALESGAGLVVVQQGIDTTSKIALAFVEYTGTTGDLPKIVGLKNTIITTGHSLTLARTNSRVIYLRVF